MLVLSSRAVSEEVFGCPTKWRPKHRLHGLEGEGITRTVKEVDPVNQFLVVLSIWYLSYIGI